MHSNCGTHCHKIWQKHIYQRTKTIWTTQKKIDSLVAKTVKLSISFNAVTGSEKIPLELSAAQHLCSYFKEREKTLNLTLETNNKRLPT